MQTRTEYAVYIETGDQIVDDVENLMLVRDIEDDGDYVLLTVVEEDGEVTQLSFAPFDEVSIVETFDDADEV